MLPLSDTDMLNITQHGSLIWGLKATLLDIRKEHFRDVILTEVDIFASVAPTFVRSVYLPSNVPSKHHLLLMDSHRRNALSISYL